MANLEYLVDGEELLDEDVVSLVEAYGAAIEEASGQRLSFAYSQAHGFNVHDEGGFHRIYVANFCNGSYSTYDAWEYTDETWDKIEPLFLELVEKTSSDGQAHCR